MIIDKVSFLDKLPDGKTRAKSREQMIMVLNIEGLLTDTEAKKATDRLAKKLLEELVQNNNNNLI